MAVAQTRWMNPPAVHHVVSVVGGEDTRYITHILLHPAVHVTLDKNYYIPVTTTLFPAGDVCCLGRLFHHISHIQAWVLIINIPSCTYHKFFN
jgi:hypothetical protein